MRQNALLLDSVTPVTSYVQKSACTLHKNCCQDKWSSPGPYVHPISTIFVSTCPQAIITHDRMFDCWISIVLCKVTSKRVGLPSWSSFASRPWWPATHDFLPSFNQTCTHTCKGTVAWYCHTYSSVATLLIKNIFLSTRPLIVHMHCYLRDLFPSHQKFSVE